VTVGIVVKVPGYGAVLGCDSRVTADGGAIMTDEDEKWLTAGTTVSCCAGQLAGVWDALRESPPDDFDELRHAFTEAPSAANFETLTYDRVRDKIWWCSNNGEAIDRGAYATIGSGGDVALGVLDALPAPKTLAQAEKLVRRALEAACKRNCACGGRLRILTIPGRRGKITGS
jgi:hypothetical protein